MTAALRYELVRIRTIRSSWVAVALAVVLSAGLATLIVTNGGGTDSMGEPVIAWYPAFAFPLTLAAVIGSLVASQAIGQEHRFGLIRLTLSAFPQRGRILTAKIAVMLLGALVVALASYVGSWIGVTLAGHPMPPEGDVPPDSTYLLRGVVFVLLWALSAFALAGITRQTAIGVAVPIISGLIVEQIVSAVLFDKADWLVRVLPWSGASRWTESASGYDTSALPYYVGWQALAMFAVWVALLLAAQVALFLRRDA